MSKTTTFRFPLGNGIEFDLEFDVNQLTMCYKTANSNQCRHNINVPFEIDIDRTGSDPIGLVTIDPNSNIRDGISISPTLIVKLNNDGIHINGNAKGDSATFKS